MKKLIVAVIVPKVNLLAKFNRFPRCKDGDVYKNVFQNWLCQRANVAGWRRGNSLGS